MKKYLLSALTLSLIASVSHAGGAKPATAAKPALGSGIAVEYIDPSVRVQDDFFTHLNGKWLKSTEIPADKSSWGTFVKLDDDLRPQLRAIIEDAAKTQMLVKQYNGYSPLPGYNVNGELTLG
ncbi:MAG: peptidase, partial [Massilia sp.]|nr:peptidase [Massilia sp.]